MFLKLMLNPLNFLYKIIFSCFFYSICMKKDAAKLQRLF